MPSRNEEQRLAEPQGTAKKPRFKIEKLEERIAPRGVTRLPRGRGNGVGGSGGHCGHDACK